MHVEVVAVIVEVVAGVVNVQSNVLNRIICERRR